LRRSAASGDTRRVPPILNANAVIMCSHGGMFKFMPTTAPTVMIGGAPVLTIADQAVPMSPCPFATAAGPAPCVQLTPPTAGAAVKTTAKGVPVLLQTAMFMTIPAGAGVPVPAMVQQPGQMQVQGT
jgi:hypothetical protein